MHTISRLVVAMAIICTLPSIGTAAVIDFEAYADFQNLHGVNLGGVTITNPTNGVVEIYDNRFGVLYHSRTKAIGSFTEGAQSVNPMVFAFDLPATLVGLWGGDFGGDTDSWTLNAYDAAVGGNLVDSSNSGDFTGNPYAFLSVSGPAIRRVEAIWTGPAFGIGFDDLEFKSVPVPEPASMGLVGLGLLALAYRRSRN